MYGVWLSSSSVHKTRESEVQQQYSKAVSKIRLKSEKCAACSVFLLLTYESLQLFIDYAVAVQPQSMQPQVFKCLLVVYNVNNIGVGYVRW